MGHLWGQRIQLLPGRRDLSLPLLISGILFVNHKQLALAPDDLTIGAALLYGCFNFHFFYLYLNTILPFVKS